MHRPIYDERASVARGAAVTSPTRNEVIGSLDGVARLVRDYILAASDEEVPRLEGILSEVIRVGDRFETATNPLLIEEDRGR